MNAVAASRALLRVPEPCSRIVGSAGTARGESHERYSSCEVRSGQGNQAAEAGCAESRARPGRNRLGFKRGQLRPTRSAPRELRVTHQRQQEVLFPWPLAEVGGRRE